MRLASDRFQLSASDLANHLGCHHLTQLNLAVSKGNLAPPEWRDPALEALQERGLALEQAYLDHLRGQGFRIAEPGPDEDGSALKRTIAAMRGGADIIYQATLGSDRWHGRADFLQRIDRPSRLGTWSYEVLDAKLARDTRAGTILQLCLYSHMVADLQGNLPERMHVILPGGDFKPLSFRVHDFLAYHRLVQRQLETAVAGTADFATYPDPVPQCDICRWWPVCDQRRHDDDHLCLVAGVSKLQINELRSWGVSSLTALAELPLPLARRPSRGAVETYERMREQARVQLERRRTGALVWEPLLPVTDGRGFCRLPEPSPGDIFFDIESDSFVDPSGLEYLLGWTTGPSGEAAYHNHWAFGPAEEKAAFEAFIDLVVEQRSCFPNLHVYHYSPYEPAALKRLMGRYATREAELDRMLRAQLFVDLYAVVRQAVRVSVERYTLKDLEAFHRFERAVPLRQASLHLHAFERAVELGRLEAISDATRAVIESYNRDDCLSTMRLRDWLEMRRGELVAAGHSIPRPERKAEEPSEDVDKHQQRVQELYHRLTRDISPNPHERTEEGQGRWLLANMLDWHRREQKAVWWEYFRLRDLPDVKLIEERAALAGLTFVERVGTPKRSVVDRYRFPPQECELRAGDHLKDGDGRPFGAVEAIDVATCTIDIRRGRDSADLHASSIFRFEIFRDGVKREALMRLGEWIADNGIDAPGPHRASRDLLLRRAPRPLLQYDVSHESLKVACDWVMALDHSILPIQGPPGSGKTFTGAHMILALVQAGRKVGITALGHKVIRNLLDTVVEVAGRERTAVRCIQSVKEPSEKPCAAIVEVKGNDARPLQALQTGEADVAAGTGWLWARPEYLEAVDVLFVDEAGQLSLADVLAVAQAAKSVVLLGDPQQLKQPQQGSHPEGTDVSALEHLLGKHETIPRDRGLFLGQTHRLHPNVCAFTSELFYNCRLRPLPDLEHQVLDGPTPFRGAGLWFVPVDHNGNQSSSPEEVECVARLVGELLGGGVHWTNKENQRRPLKLDDILIIAPYNAQVAALAARLPARTRIGTVDKFQGQAAAVVIFSLATSSPEDAPRGMEFLYSLNRLNVAVSRAKTACILVANSRLFEPECRTPAQMRLANAFCRYLELAQMISATSAQAGHP